jgi:hypothetical protein
MHAVHVAADLLPQMVVEENAPTWVLVITKVEYPVLVNEDTFVREV